MNKQLLLSLLVISLSSLLCSCGGGGGGSAAFVGAATVNISAQPSVIDSGDRSLISINIGDVHENGIALKIRYPSGLRYVPASGLLTVNEREEDITPTVNALSEDDDAIYLVFYLPQSLFKTSGEEYNGEQGTLQLQLEGREAVQNGRVEVDADVDDPQESNSSEFDLSNPEFAAESEAFIRVVEG